jgi:hypothetical protein
MTMFIGNIYYLFFILSPIGKVSCLNVKTRLAMAYDSYDSWLGIRTVVLEDLLY